MSSLPDAKPANSLSGDAVGDLPGESGGHSAAQADVTWQRELAGAVRTLPALLAALKIPEQDVPEASAAAVESFRLLVPQSFLNRMQPGNPGDPLLLQVLPQAAEQRQVSGFVADPVGDAEARLAPGLLQKYDGRALLIATGSCAVHCRYCFRRDYPYSEEPRRKSDWEPAIAQLHQDAEITEVILSGGDPLMLQDDRLAWLVKQIDEIPHVQRIRLHTRLPVVLPSRVTDQLIETLLSTRCQVIVVIHANHAHEIVGDCRAALRRLVTSGLPVLNQAVLLKHVNDTADDLESLCTALINTGVMPYYLHLLDRVTGTAHFDVPGKQAWQLMKTLRARLPGYAVPRLVQELPGRDSKTPAELIDVEAQGN